MAVLRDVGLSMGSAAAVLAQFGLSVSRSGLCQAIARAGYSISLVPVDRNRSPGGATENPVKLSFAPSGARLLVAFLTHGLRPWARIYRPSGASDDRSLMVYTFSRNALVPMAAGQIIA